MKKGTPNWSAWQTAFFVPLVVLNLNQGKAVDAAHARAAAIFRLTVSAVCVVGLIVVFLLQKKAAASADENEPVSCDAAEPAISVTYSGTREDNWRSEWYALFHRPFCLAAVAVFGLILAFLMANPLYKINATLAYVAFPVLWVIATCLWVGYILLLTWAGLQQRYPQLDSVRVCTTSLTAEGFIDVTPDRVIVLPWAKIHTIREHDGDLHFWGGFGAGCYIPRGAFPTPEARQRFFEAAISLWKSKGESWDQVGTSYGVGS
jgi:hypothetical protein